MEELLHIILPIAIGALIGYCTNYIAIKMLFLPRNEILIAGHKLPFTPGVIPKNKSRIAAAVGAAVSEKLLTEEDIVCSIKESNIAEKAAADMTEFFMRDETTVESIIAETGTNIDVEKFSEQLSSVFSEKILDGVKKADLNAVVADVAAVSFADLLANPLVAMFMGGNAMNMLSDKIVTALRAYIDEHGYELAEPIIRNETETMLSEPLNKHLEKLRCDETMIYNVIESIMKNFTENKLPQLIGEFRIKDIVEQKINEMAVKDLEELVLSVMKKELQTVINLGALIGAVIGTVNIFA